MHKLIASVFLCFVCVATAQADVFSSAQFRIVAGEEDNDYRFTAQLPATLVQSDELILPQGCTIEGVNAQRFGVNTLLTYDFHCQEALKDGAEIVTPWYLDGAKLQVNTGSYKFSTTLKRSLNTMVVPLSQAGPLTLSATETVKRYVWQGMLHIWFGWDHLVFVLCLCLLAHGRRLLALITTFTVGHSLTLALSYFQWVSLPIAPVEVLIALSICLMAREAMLCLQDHKKVAMTASVGVVVLFGLIHGLGFASALSELGVPQNEVGLALLFFNVGVEIGQVIFIGVVYLVGVALQQTALEQKVRYVSLLFVGTLGMFWVVERINGFGGGLI
jgi:hypothetical protein